MKLSIWQQFSSNHSASFVVVGRFSDYRKARKTFSELTETFVAIQTWRNAIYEWRKKHEDDDAPPEKPAINIAKKYTVEWDNPKMDWFDIDCFSENPTNNVAQIDSDIFIGVDFETWQPPTPIQKLFKAMGAESVYTDNHEPEDLKVQLKFILPTKNYSDVYEKFRILLLAIQEDMWFRQDLYIPWRDSKFEDDLDYTVEECKNIHSNWRTGEVSCELVFFALHIGFPPMIKWLRDNGCRKIEYTFSSTYSTDEVEE